jgi:hypothetical protein
MLRSSRTQQLTSEAGNRREHRAESQDHRTAHLPSQTIILLYEMNPGLDIIRVRVTAQISARRGPCSTASIYSLV